MDFYISKKRIMFLSLIVIFTVVGGLYVTYAVNVYVEEGTSVNYDMSLNFDLSNILDMQVVVPVGKRKVFDLDITNPYNDSVKYGVAYTMVSPTTLPSGVTIAKLSTSKNETQGLISASSTVTTSIVVENLSLSSVTITFSVINGYKNGGDLIIPTGRTLVSGIYEFGPKSISDKIISLSQGDTWSSGTSGVYKTNDHEYRYIGANVNNYVSFNNDIYRIIGVFDSNSHGVSGQNLVKLIPANVMTANSWGIYNSSNTSGTYLGYATDWTGATTGVKANLNVLLNEYFYNKTNTSSTYGACSNWTYYDKNTNYRTNDCTLITGYGINSTYQNYIENTTWYLYGYSENGLSKQNFYLCERGQYDGCTSANSGAYSTSTQAKIGLMYVSDYMYASGYFSSSDTTTGSSDYYGNQNWLCQGDEWTITPESDLANSVFYVNGGNVYGWSNAGNGYAVRPTFYLKSDVYVTGGDGTFSNPYTISM